MKILFAGTPDVALPTLELVAQQHDVVGVITRPDAPIGRKRTITPSPVAVAAEALNVEILKTSRFDAATSAFIRNSGAELGVVVAYGALIPQSDLALLPHGWINLHFSHLPQWRGAAPLQRDIMAGATHANLSIFQLVAELDAGDVFDAVATPFSDRETAGEALVRLARIGAERVAHVVDQIESGSAVATRQVGEVSYAHKLSADDGRLHPGMSSSEAFNTFRGVTPEPGAWIESRSGRVKILEAEPNSATSVTHGGISVDSQSVVIGFSDGGLSLITVQPAGKTAMTASDWARGLPNPTQWTFS